MVKVNNITQLRIKRSFTMAGGTEHIQLYDWQSASYPYASWIDISVLAPTTTPSTTVINVPDIARYIDYEGTAYVRVVGTGLPGGDVLKIDSLRLQDK
jgi:hypothetical protein